MTVDRTLFRSLPKVSLHDHLDGGLRPATIIELAAEIGYSLPTTDADALGKWFRASADSGSLVRYLETFDHTIAVMQTAAHLQRVAAEFVEDLAADGVVYGETRWAPQQHTRNGLSEAAAVEAVRDGLAAGMATCRARGQQIEVRQLLTSMRQSEPTTRIAELTLTYRDEGVAGFDLAGPEDGFAPERFLPAFQRLRRDNAVYTIHAGEGAGVESIWAAVQLCAATRIGHGVRIIDDITFGADGTATLGRLAAYVRDCQVPLELCPSSNVQTGAVASLAEHPIHTLDELGFCVTMNSDNQLMSGTCLSEEFALVSEAHSLGLDWVERLTVNAARSAFLPWDRRQALIDDIIRPGFAAAAG